MGFGYPEKLFAMTKYFKKNFLACHDNYWFFKKIVKRIYVDI